MKLNSIPLGIATALVNQTEKRRSLGEGTFAHVVGQGSKTLRMAGRKIENDADWLEFLAMAVRMATEEPREAVLLTYSIEGEQTDGCVLLTPNAEPEFLEWRYGPEFALGVTSAENADQMRQGVGVSDVQAILDRTAG